jgi:hypothetical protein
LPYLIKEEGTNVFKPGIHRQDWKILMFAKTIHHYNSDIVPVSCRTQRMIRAGLISLKKEVGIDEKKVINARKTHPEKYCASASFVDTFGVRGAESSKYGEKELGQFKWQ